MLQLCPVLCHLMDPSPPDYSVHGILQARILAWVAMLSSRGIFPTQGSNLCLLWLLTCRWILYLLNHWGSPFCVCAVLCFVAQSCPTLCDPMDCSLSGSSVHGDSPGKNTGVGCHALLQGIFPTQGSNPGLSHCRQILYHLNHQGSPSFSKPKICLSDSPDNFKKLFFSHSLFPCVF